MARDAYSHTYNVDWDNSGILDLPTLFQRERDHEGSVLGILENVGPH